MSAASTWPHSGRCAHLRPLDGGVVHLVDDHQQYAHAQCLREQRVLARLPPPLEAWQAWTAGGQREPSRERVSQPRGAAEAEERKARLGRAIARTATSGPRSRACRGVR
eukprot:2851049-Prymnesium_polylepis.2